MGWTTKYWDILDQLYWWPRYMGFRSIGQKHWQQHGGMVCIPAEMVNMTGPLYSRERKADDLRRYLSGSEEILNHVFDLTFAIAPDAVIHEAFCAPLGFSDDGSFESVGRETAARYGWGKSDNITQHDGLFVSQKSAIAVELKLLSPSWPEQIAKYAAILTWEEQNHGRRDNLGLLFIVPEKAMAGHWRKCGLTSAAIDGSWLDRTWTKPLPKAVSKLFTTHEAEVRSVLDRLTISVISWTELHATLAAIQVDLDQAVAGQQTLYRLLTGFIAQLVAHRDTGIIGTN